MEIKSSGSASKAFAVFLKDLKSELRTRYAINAILMFALVTVFAISWAIGGAGLSEILQASLLWVVIYFSSLSGLSQSFVKEEESKTALALRLYCPASAVLGGKMIFNLILLSVLNLLTIPLFGIFIGLDIHNFPLFIIIIILGSLGIVATTTLAAAIISKASIKGALFAVLSFPLILPLMMMAISGTKKALIPESVISLARMEIQVLVSYVVVMTVLGFILFDSIWND
ncbi:MAG: heme exporter protein CcmB [Candidatus Zixiibacteriota bacterium]|nr:MAG: heme exporter protein CcmB [candidate division Zixibacteria bacterium]